MFDLNDPNNKKAFLTGVVVGEQMNKHDDRKTNPAPESGGSFLWTLVGYGLALAVVVILYIVLMN